MNINDRIKLLRTKANMTQEELGELLGVQKAAIQKYESGSIINFKLETIENISKIFNVSPNYLIGYSKFDDKYDLEKLKEEVHIVEILDNFFGDLGVELYKNISNLNRLGLEKIIEYSEDITKNPKYTK